MESEDAVFGIGPASRNRRTRTSMYQNVEELRKKEETAGIRQLRIEYCKRNLACVQLKLA